ncbi:MAG: D-aminoacyl-tRNA deacylase [Armatimonadota bacterium]|nr:D-aminoacyl-tRNA deacylase [Armatimonadota bacterium]MDR7426875.1 D-aminoacyl-tRNA deacylase [Armatimonadota bacterium]MDR7465353.1 D-aminoacyl-tRNA deacylase [Armatimonadota bacterium]MDR7468822.1 D-aminoacyl-tRNA deacylase [Armatimonadota bacterium]MDR7473657.1 D-aminoacyl-tRNA deacylase [Armatimonadota bacterium]
MRLVVQRVRQAAVRLEGEVAASIGPGLVVLVGVRATDTPAEARWLAEKVANLRIFGDETGRLNRSVLEVGGAVLSVSQFTLYGDISRGRRPSFVEAAASPQAEAVYEAFNQALRALGVPVATGRFGAVMLVEIHNDGPVTILLERERMQGIGR